MLLGGHAAWHCAVAVQNDFNRLIPKEPWQPSPEKAARQEAGRVFEAEVFGLLQRLHPDAVVIEPALRRTEAVAEGKILRIQWIGLFLFVAKSKKPYQCTFPRKYLF